MANTAPHARFSRWASSPALLVHPRPTILPLEAIAEAHELVASGTVIGKVMLR
jgi:hypothetical protein